MMTHLRWLVGGGALLLVGLLMMALIGGCGGGAGGTIPGPDPEPTPSASTTPYSAAFHVDVATGEVNLSTPATVKSKAGMMGTKAVLTGTAVAFESSRLVEEGGNIGVRALRVRVRNQTQRSLSNARLLFGEFTNVTGWSDLLSQVQVSTLAGTGTAGYLDGAALSARLSGPAGVTVDDRGDIYFTDRTNNRVRKLSGGLVTTVAGNGTSATVDGLGTAAEFREPLAIVFYPRDRALYVTEAAGHRVRRIDSRGYVSTVAGTGVAGSTNGTGAVATLNTPAGLATDGTNLFVTDFGGQRLRKIAVPATNTQSAGSYLVSTVAGNGAAGSVDGVGAEAQFCSPYGVAYGSDGMLYVADSGAQRIRRVDPVSGAVVTIAGTGATGAADGYGSAATFSAPIGIAALPDRGQGVSLVVADSSNKVLRQLRLNSNGSASPSSAGSWLVQTLTDNTNFKSPKLLAADGSGNILVADWNANKLLRARPTSGFFPIGVATGSTVAEPVRLANAAGMFPWAGGDPRPWLACPDLAGGATSDPLTWSFAIPEGLTAFEFTVTLEAATDPYSPVEAAIGAGSARVLVRTLAGSTSNENGFIDGMGTNARFECLIGAAVDAQGVVYAADCSNHAVRRIEPNGRVTTVAGVVGMGAGTVNGRGNVASLNYPTSVALVPPNTFSSDGALPAGTQPICLLVTDLNSYRVRLIRGPYTNWNADKPWEPWSPSFYQVATIAGGATSEYVNGRGDLARFSAPSVVAAGPGGVFYVLERGLGNRVRTLQYTGGDPMSAANWQVGLLAGSSAGAFGYVDASGSSAQFNDPRGLTVGPAGDVYIADTYNHCIRKITPNGAVTTLAGTNLSDYTDASGGSARFDRPWAIACGPDGYLYTPDRFNYRVRRISPTGVVTTVAGTGSFTLADGRGDQAGFYDDLGIAMNSSGDLYVIEAECVRLIQRIVDVGDVVASN